MTTTDKPTRTTDETGREIITYPSGVVKDAINGHFLRGPSSPELNPVIRDPVGMRRRGIELAQARTRQAINDEVGNTLNLDLSNASDSDGWYWLIRHTVSVYLNSKNVRGLGEVLAKLGQAAGYIGRDGEARPAAPQGTITGTPETIRALMEILQEEIDRRVIQAQAIDAEEA